MGTHDAGAVVELGASEQQDLTTRVEDLRITVDRLESQLVDVARNVDQLTWDDVACSCNPKAETRAFLRNVLEYAKLRTDKGPAYDLLTTIFDGLYAR